MSTSRTSEQLEKQDNGSVHVIDDSQFSGDRQLVEKKLVRKLDLRFSILIIIYILNYLDRNNMSSARTKGIIEDLKLTNTQYNTLLSILYVGYIIMQVPSNMIVQYTGRPSIFLPLCMAIWGTISCLTGITHNFTGALLTRFFLGFVEAPFFAGAIFLLSKWYTKRELGLRTAILYCGSLISNAFGPLVAAGILGNMEGVRGIRAWRWLFFIEGAITIGVAIIAVPILPDFPHNARFFTEEERKLAELRMAEDVGEKDDDTLTPWRAFVETMTDVKVWVLAFATTAMVVGLTFNQFFPTLTSSLYSKRTIALVLAAPPFFWATLVAFANARHSDKTGERFWHIIVFLVLGIVGFIIAMATKNIGARYFSLFLMSQSYASFVVLYSWFSASFPRPAMKRAIAIAFINCFSQLGNVAGSYVFPSHWGPSYAKSYGICISCFVACMALLFVHRTMLQRLNKRLEENEQAGVRGETVALNMPTGFRYML